MALKKYNTESIKERFNSVHGVGTYDYSKVEYKGGSEKVTIICPKHGEFSQVANYHSAGSGCQVCKLESLSKFQKSKVSLVYGHGISTDGKYARTYRDENGKMKSTREYELWRGIIRRCYSEKVWLKQPTYEGCTVSENFKNFQWFAEWCNNQIGWDIELVHIDKDLLCKDGIKIYSEDRCVFLPHNVNTLLLKSDAIRGEYPVGVHYNRFKEKFEAYCRNGTRNGGYIGQFDNPEDAFAAYKKRKEETIKTLANQYKEFIDPRAYEALMNYEVRIDD